MGDTAEQATIKEFEQRYQVMPTEVTRQVERAVIGGDWGANGYTTMEQAYRLGRELALARPPGCLTLAPDEVGLACPWRPRRAVGLSWPTYRPTRRKRLLLAPSARVSPIAPGA
jgi:hypothetical protein